MPSLSSILLRKDVRSTHSVNPQNGGQCPIHPKSLLYTPSSVWGYGPEKKMKCQFSKVRYSLEALHCSGENCEVQFSQTPLMIQRIPSLFTNSELYSPFSDHLRSFSEQDLVLLFLLEFQWTSPSGFGEINCHRHIFLSGTIESLHSLQ